MVYITAVHMEGTESHEHIASVRWRNPSSGKTGQNSRQEMVDWIKNENGVAKVQGTGGASDVSVGVVEASPPYLRTYADRQWTNNLLSLPRY